MEGLTEEQKKALRGSKFAPLPSATNHNQFQPRLAHPGGPMKTNKAAALAKFLERKLQEPNRLAHPGGPMKTNKAAALAKFLERKLQEPNGLASVNPKLVELAVKNAKQTVQRRRIIHHVDTFGDDEDSNIEEITETTIPKKNKQKKKKKKQGKNQKKKQKNLEDSIVDTSKQPKKKLKL